MTARYNTLGAERRIVRGTWYTLAKVDEYTWLLLDDAGQPCYVRSHRSNLDQAFDDAQRHWGAPLDCGTWQPSNTADDAWEVACSVAECA